MAEYQKYTGDGTGLNVRTRGGRDPYKYSYAAPLMVSYLNSLSSVGGGGWAVGDLSKEGGGKYPGHASHLNGLDVDISLPLTDGGMSIVDKGDPKTVSNKSWNFKDISADELDIEKTIKFLDHSIKKGATKIYLDKAHIRKIKASLQSMSGLPGIPDSLKSDERKGYIERMIKLLAHEPNHKDHFHVRLRGALSSKSGDIPDKDSDRSPEERKAGEDSDEREKSRIQFKRRLVPRKFNSATEAAERIYTDGDFREWFYGLWLKTVEGDEGTRKKIYNNIKKFNESDVDLDNSTSETLDSLNRYYNARGRANYKSWRKLNPFMMTSPMQENKRNEMMKITKERLAQIIKEEVESYKVSQLNESMDADEIEESEAYIKEVADLLKMTYEQLFKGAAPTVGTPQTKADTGEDVTDDTAHEDAKAIILDLLGDAIDEFKQGPPELNEDGHDDVPSAVRAMKTMAEDALEMLDALEQMDGNLPTWWTNKMAVSASMLNKMRDYLLVPSVEEDIDEQ